MKITGAFGLTAAVVAASLLLPSSPSDPVAPASAATAVSLSASPTDPVAKEQVRFGGRLTTRYGRPVRLQRWTGSKWAVVDKGRAVDTGRFSLIGRMTAGTAKFRVVAPRTQRSSAQTTATRKLTAVVPTSTSGAVPAPIGQTKSGARNRTPVEVSFRPARAGRPVVLQQRQLDGSWVDLEAGAQDSRGRVTFLPAVSGLDSRSLRAVARSFRGASPVTTSEVVPLHWARPFHDDFVGTSLDLTKWAYRQLNVEPYGNRMCAQSTKDTVSVADGYLYLRVKRKPDSVTKTCPYGQYKNAHISTVSDGSDPTNLGHVPFDTRYGIMAARLKFPHAPGQHGSFWAQPTSPDVTGDPSVDGAEIDTAEYYGDGRKDGGLSHLIHWQNSAGELKSSGGIVNADRLLRKDREWSDDYHVYSVEWTPTRYIFRVDGTTTFETTRGVSGVAEYPILSLLTSDWELPKLKVPALNPMTVDWVQVWDRP